MTAIGISVLIVLSMANGILAVLTRRMQSIHVSVMMAYIAIISFIILSTCFIIERLITGNPLRILNYTFEQYSYGFAAGALNIAALLFKIIAF